LLLLDSQKDGKKWIDRQEKIFQWRKLLEERRESIDSNGKPVFEQRVASQDIENETAQRDAKDTIPGSNQVR
jgi:hypothetical protein